MTAAAIQARHIKLVRAEAAAGAAFGHATEEAAAPRSNLRLLAVTLAVVTLGTALASSLAFAL